MLKVVERIKAEVEADLSAHVVEERSARSLVFKRPGTGVNALRYSILGTSTLVVTGDLGSAVYQWHGNPALSWAWLADLSFDYFLGKCQASEVGRDFSEWDAAAAREAFASVQEGLEPKERRRISKMIEDNDDEFASGDEVFETREAWNSFAIRSLYAIWPDLDGILDIGMIPARRALFHHAGLVLAQARVAEGGR